MKGISPLISGTIFILITIVIATLIVNFMTQISREHSESLQSTTANRLKCEMANMFVDSIVYDCNMNCITGVPYSLNASIKNSGSVHLSFEKAQIILKNGEVYTLYGNKQNVDVGELKDINFDAIQVSSSPNLPIEGSFQEFDSDSDTKGLWHFNEAVGITAYDSSPFGNNGTIFSSWNKNGRFGYGLDFNGINNVVYVPSSPSLDIAGPITLEAWIKPFSNQEENAGIVCKGFRDNESYCMDVINGNKVRFFIRSGEQMYSAVSTNNLKIGEWNRVAGVYDNSNVIIYLNGKKTTGDAATGSININSYNISIGARDSSVLSGPDLAFNGTIDEVRISNTTRTYKEGYDSVNISIRINYPEIDKISVYNSANTLLLETNLNGIDYYETETEVSSYDKYKIVVNSGDKTIYKWYPSESGNCIEENEIEKVVISSKECPNTAYDSFPASDIIFVGCIT